MIQPSPQLRELLAGAESALTLDLAALELASIDNPELDSEAALRTLDDWAAAIAGRVSPQAPGAQYLSAANRYLFEEMTLRGDSEDYYAPANSCLDQALVRRRGLPLTLSIIYTEIARRLGRPVFGVGLPAHFICIYDDGEVPVFIDVFDRGRLMTEDDCLDLVEERTGQRFEVTPVLFAPAARREIVLRMMNNLYGAYRRRGDALRAGTVEDWFRQSIGT
ncbi:MAG: transglutaminase family protein [Bryobacterales bacterium]|nr:transglutaminase family protein [Bryobacterales bacterium]